MMYRVAVTPLVAILLGVFPAACSGLIPSGACDDYDQGARLDVSSCTADGKLSHTRATSCSTPEGPTNTTTTTACDPGEHCVAEDASRTAACFRTCVTSDDCEYETLWCRSGACVPALEKDSECSTSSLCAPGFKCTISLTMDPSATDAGDGGDGGDDGGDALEQLCADGHPASRDCRCR